MVVARKPARDEVISQPSPPTDDEHRLREEFDDCRSHIHEGKRREDEQELMPERNRIVVLNRIEQVAVEEVQPYNYADLSLIDEHEENDHRNTDPPL